MARATHDSNTALWLGRALLLGILVASPHARAQSPKELLEKARLAEVAEGNPRKAASLYRQVTTAGGSPDLMSEAFYRLGLCLRKTSPQDAREAFSRAVAAGGAAANDAQAALGGSQEDPRRLKARVLQALKALRLGKDRAKAGYRELRWIGKAGVPYVIQAAKNEQIDLEFVANAVQVLIDIGGEEVARFVRETRASPDVLQRRAMIKGISRASGGDEDPVRRELIQFLEDPDPTARQEALPAVWSRLTKAERRELLNHDLPAFRRRALVRLLDRYQSWIYSPSTAPKAALAEIRTLVPHLKKLLERTRGSKDAMPVPVLAVAALTGDGRAMLCDHLAKGAYATGAHSLRATVFPGNAPLDPPVSADRLAAAQRAQGDATALAVHRMLRRLVARSLWSWNSEATLVVAQLATAGYEDSENLSRWLATRAAHTHAADVIAALPALAKPEPVIKSLGRMDLDASVLPTLKRSIAAIVAQKSPRLGAGRFLWIADRARGDVSTWLMEVTQMSPELEADGYAMLRRRNDPRTIEYLLTLLTRDASTPGALHPRSRNLTLLRLSELRAEKVAAMWPTAYEKGLEPAYFDFKPRDGYPASLVEEWGKIGTQLRGIAGLVRLQMAGRSCLPASTVARIIDACVKTDVPQIWEDLHALIDFLPRALKSPQAGPNGEGSVLSDEIASVICRHVLSIPGSTKRRDAATNLLDALEVGGGPRFRAFLAACLRCHDAAVRYGTLSGYRKFVMEKPHRALLVERITDSAPRVARLALQLTRQLRDPELAKAVHPLTEQANSDLRIDAIHTLSEILPDRATEYTLTLLRDPSSTARRLGCLRSRLVLDDKLVPELMKLLRDPNAKLRDEAKKSLQAIRFYREEKARWDRYFNGADLGGTSAALALLGQASAGNPRDVRLAAIASLGTLGVPETLPTLIKYMTGKDEGIAAAARAAVAKINARPQPKSGAEK